jgi:hypothetical protein
MKPMYFNSLEYRPKKWTRIKDHIVLLLGGSIRTCAFNKRKKII